MKDQVYIIGHKNPDTDSIVSAIAYAALKKAMGIDAVAARLGGVNSESEYLLKRFGFDEPLNMFSAKTILKELDLDKPYLVSKELTIKEALELMLKDTAHRSIYVADSERHLEGIVAIDDLTALWTFDDQKLKEMVASATLDSIVKTLDAEVILDGRYFSDGTIDFFPNYESKINKHSIVIVGNTPEIQRRCLDEKIALLIIVGESWVDDHTLKKAKDKNIPIIATRLSPLAVSQLIYQAPIVGTIMTPKEKIMSFSTRDTVDEAQARMSSSHFSSHPVLNHTGQIVGSLGRHHLLDYDKKRFILVDHNEMSQSINDIEYGEVVEVVDHHRFGGLETSGPINITTMQVGATCTIIALKYKENNITIPKDMAGLLLGGILADTLAFKSPTTTDLDYAVAKDLERISGVMAEELYEGLVESGESLLDKRNIEIVYNDFKEFDISGLKVGISQTTCKSADEFKQVKGKMVIYLSELCMMNKYDILVVMFTMASGSGSYFLCDGLKKETFLKAMTGIIDEDGYAPEVVSRKKQVLPRIVEVLERKER